MNTEHGITADDLNPLYVFEAKMSLLIRVAQTRQGAERLLECRLLPTLADCDFLDTRPEENQAFMGASIVMIVNSVRRANTK